MNSCFSIVQHLCTGHCWSFTDLGNTESLVVIKQTVESKGQSKRHFEILSLSDKFFFSTVNRVFHYDNSLYHKDETALKLQQEGNAEFQLMS